MRKSILLLLLFLLFHCQSLLGSETPKDFITIKSGVYKINDTEYYLSEFLISKKAFPGTPDSLKKGYRLPTREEHLAAASHKEFEVSAFWEHIERPPEDICLSNDDELEAEGICGAEYFAGIGQTEQNQSDLIHTVQGGKDPRTTISKVFMTDYYLDQKKPKSEGIRYVKDSKPVFPKKAYLKGDGINVRVGRGTNYARRMIISQNSKLAFSVLFCNDTWCFIEAEGRHNCNQNPEYDNFLDTGWIRKEFIKEEGSAQELKK